MGDPRDGAGAERAYLGEVSACRGRGWWDRGGVDTPAESEGVEEAGVAATMGRLAAAVRFLAPVVIFFIYVSALSLVYLSCVAAAFTKSPCFPCRSCRLAERSLTTKKRVLLVLVLCFLTMHTYAVLTGCLLVAGLFGLDAASHDDLTVELFMYDGGVFSCCMLLEGSARVTNRAA